MHPRDRFALFPRKTEKQIIWWSVISLPNAYEVTNPWGWGSEYFSIQGPQQNQVSWKLVVDTTNQQLVHCAYNFFASLPDEFCLLHSAGHIVDKDSIYQSTWSGILAMSVEQALRGGNNRLQIFSWRWGHHDAKIMTVSSWDWWDLWGKKLSCEQLLSRLLYVSI